jgi:PD-(D/E)XK endonuclease
VLTTDQKGSIAETAIVAAAARLGIGVFKPLTDGERYDLIFDLRPRLVRVQCKWARIRGDVVVVRCYSCRRTADGLTRRVYSQDEIDAFAAYCAELDRAYFLWVADFPGRSAVQLRLTPTRNQQKLLINWASDFEFAATLSTYVNGAIAQLGERLSGTQKVAGSSPAGSTPKAASGGLRLFSA